MPSTPLFDLPYPDATQTADTLADSIGELASAVEDRFRQTAVEVHQTVLTARFDTTSVNQWVRVPPLDCTFSPASPLSTFIVMAHIKGGTEGTHMIFTRLARGIDGATPAPVFVHEDRYNMPRATKGERTYSVSNMRFPVVVYDAPDHGGSDVTYGLDIWPTLSTAAIGYINAGNSDNTDAETRRRTASSIVVVELAGPNRSS